MSPSRPHVLIVEDNEANLYLARFLLERAGAEVTHAGDGRQCLEAVRAQRPDVIVMDLQMPQMDGYETARRLREDPATATIPLLASSAFAQGDMIERAMAAGFADYIAKPYDPEAFTTQVLTLASRGVAGG